MSSCDSIPEILERAAALLADHNQETWARACRSHASAFANDPKGVKGQVRSMYGGMGSFNDVILHGNDGSIPREENIVLDELRSKLFELCRESS